MGTLLDEQSVGEKEYAAAVLREKLRTRKGLEDYATELGCTLVLRENMQVLLDLDGAVKLDVFKARFADKLIRDTFPDIRIAGMWKSRGGNTHVVLDVGVPLQPAEAVIVALALGSDDKRGFLFVKDGQDGDEINDCLFRPITAEEITLDTQV